MSDSPPVPNRPDRPEDFDGLRAELATLLAGFQPIADDLWPRLEDHRSRWELYACGLADGYNKLVTSDIIDQLGAALANLAGARDRLSHAFLKADDHSQDS